MIHKYEEIEQIRILNNLKLAFFGGTKEIKLEAARFLARALPQEVFFDGIIAGELAQEIPEIIRAYEEKY